MNAVTVVDPLAEKRKLFNDTLRETGYYPNVRYPGDCYIFDVVLGIDPREIVIDSITPTGYKKFIIDPMTHKRRMKTYTEDKADGTTDVWSVAEVTTRKFTPHQRKVLAEWWELLSVECREHTQHTATHV